MITKEQWRGTQFEANQPKHFQAGSLSCDFIDGRLQNIAFGERVLVSEIYFALRDPNWGTIPFTINNIQTETGQDSFLIDFSCQHSQGKYHYFWNGHIEGTGDSVIEYRFSGKAESSFVRNRIGFCVLHPLSCAGLPCTVVHCDGEKEEGSFPDRIAPFQPFFSIREISYQFDAEHGVTTSFSGDEFEMEDQRNWTDASYKTYCTPLSKPFPVSVSVGETTEQAVRISLFKTEKKEAETSNTIEDRPESIPFSLGIRMAEVPDELTFSRLNIAKPDHFSVELHPDEDKQKIEQIFDSVRSLGSKARVSLFFKNNGAEDLEKWLPLLRKNVDVVVSVAILSETEKTPEPKVLQTLRQALMALQVSLGTGTNGYFTQVNRETIQSDCAGFICYANTPQVHAFDNRSILSTVEGQKSNLQSCFSKYNRLPVFINPLTMRIRWNPDATEKIVLKPGERPGDVDDRQISLFAAAWFLSSVSACAEAGAAGMTCFECVGPRGIMEAENKSYQYSYISEPGMAYPLLFAFAFINNIRRAKLTRSIRGDVLCIRLEDAEEVRMLYVNLSEEEKKIEPYHSRELDWLLVDEKTIPMLSKLKDETAYKQYLSRSACCPIPNSLSAYAILFAEYIKKGDVVS